MVGGGGETTFCNARMGLGGGGHCLNHVGRYHSYSYLHHVTLCLLWSSAPELLVR